MNLQDEKIRIVGSGVMGLTTGICLNIAGYDTEIITKNIPKGYKYVSKTSQELATEYAAASVKPSTIGGGDLYINNLLSDSILIFDIMEEYKTFIENIPHYLGGDNYVKPFYSQILREFDCEVENPPGGIPNSCVFNSHFVHMPYYIQYLIETYEQTGGEIEKREVEHLDDVEDFVINCTGIGSNNLVEDDTIEKIKGHLAYVETGFQLEKDGEPFSYAYDINDQSVYCYPQLDRIVLGGTTISEKEENENYDFYSFNGNNIPKHIIDENRKILQDYCGLDILDYEIHGVSGYRPYRKEGPRIEKENYTIHNYGHGGSGVTLSWGSALQVLSLLGVQKQDSIENLKNLFKHQ